MRNRILQSRANHLRKNSTDAERFLWQRLRQRQLGGFKFRRQVPVAGYVADFVCMEAMVVIDLDGGQRLDQSGYDAQRNERIKAHGYAVLRFWNSEEFQQVDAVMERILAVLRRPAPTLTLPRERGRESVQG